MAGVRELGYAVDDLENDADGRCVAVPLPGTSVPSAISLFAPAARFPSKDVGKAAKALLEVAPHIVTHPRGRDRSNDNEVA